MITGTEYNTISKNVYDAVVELLDHIKSRSLEYYIAIIADLAYKSYDGGTKSFCIDSEYKLKDNTRLRFFQDFLNNYYTFEGKEHIEDDKYRLHIEMMIYSHIWESEPFLEKIYQLSYVAYHNQFDWNPNVPDMTKDTYINETICQALENSGLALAAIIKQGYHKSLRNAFAHSEYVFNETDNYINLYNYKGGDDELKKVSFDQWTNRFVYSYMINYYIHKEMYNRRLLLLAEFGTNEFGINVSENSHVKIKYIEEKDEFVSA